MWRRGLPHVGCAALVVALLSASGSVASSHSGPWPLEKTGWFHLLPTTFYVEATSPFNANNLCMRTIPLVNGIFLACAVNTAHLMLPGEYAIYGVRAIFKTSKFGDAADTFTYRVCVGPRGDLNQYCDAPTEFTFTHGTATWGSVYVLLKSPSVRTLDALDVYYLSIQQISFVDADIDTDVDAFVWVYLSDPDSTLPETGGFVAP